MKSRLLVSQKVVTEFAPRLNEILGGARQTVQLLTADRLCAVLNVPLGSIFDDTAA